jgi:hypothetical protein
MVTVTKQYNNLAHYAGDTNFDQSLDGRDTVIVQMSNIAGSGWNGDVVTHTGGGTVDVATAITSMFMSMTGAAEKTLKFVGTTVTSYAPPTLQLVGSIDIDVPDGETWNLIFENIHIDATAVSSLGGLFNVTTAPALRGNAKFSVVFTSYRVYSATGNIHRTTIDVGANPLFGVTAYANTNYKTGASVTCQSVVLTFGYTVYDIEGRKGNGDRTDQVVNAVTKGALPSFELFWLSHTKIVCDTFLCECATASPWKGTVGQNQIAIRTEFAGQDLETLKPLGRVCIGGSIDVGDTVFDAQDGVAGPTWRGNGITVDPAYTTSVNNRPCEYAGLTIRDRTDPLDLHGTAIGAGFGVPVVWRGLNAARYHGVARLTSDANYPALDIDYADFAYERRLDYAVVDGKTTVSGYHLRKTVAGSGIDARAWSVQVPMAVPASTTKMTFRGDGELAATFADLAAPAALVGTGDPATAHGLVKRRYVAKFGPAAAETVDGDADSAAQRSVKWPTTYAGVVQEMGVVFEAAAVYFGAYTGHIEIDQYESSVTRTLKIPVTYAANDLDVEALLNITTSTGGPDIANQAPFRVNWDATGTALDGVNGSNVESSGTNVVTVQANQVSLRRGTQQPVTVGVGVQCIAAVSIEYRDHAVNQDDGSEAGALGVVVDGDIMRNVAYGARGTDGLHEGSAEQPYYTYPEIHTHTAPTGTTEQWPHADKDGNILSSNYWARHNASSSGLGLGDTRTHSVHYHRWINATQGTGAKYFARSLAAHWVDVAGESETLLGQRTVTFVLTDDASMLYSGGGTSVSVVSQNTKYDANQGFALCPHLPSADSDAYTWVHKGADVRGLNAPPTAVWRWQWVAGDALETTSDLDFYFDLDVDSLAVRGWGVADFWVAPYHADFATFAGALASSEFGVPGTRGTDLASGGSVSAATQDGKAVQRCHVVLPAGQAYTQEFAVFVRLGHADAAAVRANGDLGKTHETPMVDVTLRCYVTDTGSDADAVLRSEGKFRSHAAAHTYADTALDWIFDARWTPQGELVMLRYRPDNDTAAYKYSVSGDEAGGAHTAVATSGIRLPVTSADAGVYLAFEARPIGATQEHNVAGKIRYGWFQMVSAMRVLDGSVATVTLDTDWVSDVQFKQPLNETTGGSWVSPSPGQHPWVTVDSPQTTRGDWIYVRFKVAANPNPIQDTAALFAVHMRALRPTIETALSRPLINGVDTWSSSVATPMAYYTEGIVSTLPERWVPATFYNGNRVEITAQQSTTETVTDRAIAPVVRAKLFGPPDANPGDDPQIVLNYEARAYDSAGATVALTLDSAEAPSVSPAASNAFTTANYTVYQTATLSLAGLPATVKRVDVYASVTNAGDASPYDAITGAEAQRLATFLVHVGATETLVGASRIYIGRMFRITVNASGFSIEQLVAQQWRQGPSLNLAVSSNWAAAPSTVSADVSTTVRHGTNNLAMLTVDTDAWTVTSVARLGALPCVDVSLSLAPLAEAPVVGDRVVAVGGDGVARTARISAWDSGTARLVFGDADADAAAVGASLVLVRDPAMPSGYVARWTAAATGASVSGTLDVMGGAAQHATVAALGDYAGVASVAVKWVRLFAVYDESVHFLGARLRWGSEALVTLADIGDAASMGYAGLPAGTRALEHRFDAALALDPAAAVAVAVEGSALHDIASGALATTDVAWVRGSGGALAGVVLVE